MERFQKFLVISGEGSTLSRQKWRLDRVSWGDLSRIENLADYDALLINLSAVSITAPGKEFEDGELRRVFDARAWAHILSAGGRIFLVGYPLVDFPVPGSSGAGFGLSPRRTQAAKVPRASFKKPLASLLNLIINSRKLEYRRIHRNDESNQLEIYKYLDRVREWNYSFQNAELIDPFQGLLRDRERIVMYGLTTFETSLAIGWQIINTVADGLLMLLPASGLGCEADDAFILREFWRIDSDLPSPQWVSQLTLPGQEELRTDILEKRETAATIKKAIETSEQRLRGLQQWYRLLYDDGFSLEAVVKAAFETLGATVTRASPEKDDYRINVPGYPEGVMEVKGTKNSQMVRDDLRQLNDWMQQAIADKLVPIKGIFVGNANRNSEPSKRGPLFNDNNSKYATMQKMVTLRSMDLYVLTVLRLIGKLDQDVFWKSFFACDGPFDAMQYWTILPNEFRLDATGSTDATQILGA